MSYNIALKIAYDGSQFFGWQKTSLGISVEHMLQTHLEQILQEKVDLQAASRTDRGVHAEAQVVNFLTAKAQKPVELQKSLNALLPKTIRVLFASYMPICFHPTLAVEKKEYHYHICLEAIQLPQERLYAWHVPYKLNFEQIASASLHFLGEHDFSSFCNFRKNLNYKDKIRTIESLEFFLPKKNHLIFAIKGNNFLYKMVRNIVGTLVYVGRGKIQAEAIPSILQEKKRALAGITAPAHGLTLKKIYYPQEFMVEI